MSATPKLCEHCVHFGALHPKPVCHLKRPKTWHWPSNVFDRSYGYHPDKPSCFTPVSKKP